MIKMKSIIILLISLLLSSCNVNSNKSEEIYYLDGLASNLFVYDVMEEYMEFTYVEETDSYDLYVGIKDKFAEGYPCDYSGERFLGLELKGKDIVIPNVYDDGVHGLKRVKSFDIQDSSVGYINSLTVSEGITECGSMLKSRIINIYLPSTINQIMKFNFIYDFYFSRYTKDGEKIQGTFDLNIIYNGTKNDFYDIEIIDNYEGVLFNKGGYVRIDCLDGFILMEILGSTVEY